MKKTFISILFAALTISQAFAGSIYHFDLGYSSAKLKETGAAFDGNSVAWGVGMSSSTASVTEDRQFSVGFGACGYVMTNLSSENSDKNDAFVFIDGTLMSGPGFMARVWDGGTFTFNAGPAVSLSLGHQFLTLGIGYDISLLQDMGESGLCIAFGINGNWMPVSVFSDADDSARSYIGLYVGLGV